MPKDSTLVVNRLALLDHLGRARLAAAKRAQIPILTHVLLRPENGELRILASDLELSYSGAVALEEGDSGAGACIAFDAFHRAIQAFEGETVSLAFGPTSVKLQSAKARGSLPTKGAEDFPSEPPVGDAKPVAAMPWDDLSALLRTAARFANVDPKATNWSTTVRLLTAGGELVALATDNHVAACIGASADYPKEQDDASLAIHSSTLGKLASVKAEGGAELALAQYHAALRSEEGWRFAFRLSDMTFPDIRNTFERADRAVLRLNLGALSAAAERAGSFAGMLLLSAKAGQEFVELTTRANDYREELPLLAPCESQFDYAVYLQYLRPILESGTGDATVYRDAGDGWPGMLKIVPDESGQEFMIAGVQPDYLKGAGDGTKAE